MHDTNSTLISKRRRSVGRGVTVLRGALRRVIAGPADGQVPGHAAARGTVLNAMSFNIRNSAAADGAYAWPRRRELAMQVIYKCDPDVIGLQEVLSDQYDDVTSCLEPYAFTGVGRDDGLHSGERALIGYRKSRFELIDAGQFWLAEDHDRPELGWDAACVRICSWARLHDIAVDRPLLVANTHWDHEGVLAREMSARLIRRKLATLSGGAAVLVLGDFNSHETDVWMTRLLDSAHGELQLADSYRHAVPVRQPDERTDHHFADKTHGMRIDYVLHSPHFKTLSAAIIRTRGADGMYPADHFPVSAGLAWRTDGGAE